MCVRYRLVRDSIVVVILVTSISLTIFVKVFLSRVGKAGTVVLKEQQNVYGSSRNSARWTEVNVTLCYFYLLAVIGGISAAHQVLIGPTVQI